MSLKVFPGSSCWDITLTSTCCRELFWLIYHRCNDFYLFRYRNRFFPNSLSFSYTSGSLKFFNYYPEIFPAVQIFEKSCTENPFILKKITVGFGVNMIASVFSSNIKLTNTIFVNIRWYWSSKHWNTVCHYCNRIDCYLHTPSKNHKSDKKQIYFSKQRFSFTN